MSYVYATALVTHGEFSTAWSCYLRMARDCWQGRVSAVIDELQTWLAPHGLDAKAKLDDKDPRKPVVDAVRYLNNNQARMDYPRYQRLGLPVTSALMESLVKDVNYRVKGTEMFWNDPDGTEAILQVRAASLCDDDRLGRYLRTGASITVASIVVLTLRRDDLSSRRSVMTTLKIRQLLMRRS